MAEQLELNTEVTARLNSKKLGLRREAYTVHRINYKPTDAYKVASALKKQGLVVVTFVKETDRKSFIDGSPQHVQEYIVTITDEGRKLLRKVEQTRRNRWKWR